MRGGVWVCVTEGFPTSVFFVDEDLTREDGVVRCKQVSWEEVLKTGWRTARALKIVLEGIAEAF
jgi:hypothetical protein